MNWETWTLFTVTETVLCFVPGPAVLLVLSQGLAHGTRKSMASSGGILAANAMYFAISATSLGSILFLSYDVFFAVKWIGAAYLVYLGIAALRARTTAAALQSTKTDPSVRRALVNGFVLQAANPKALLFFTALLPQFVDPHNSIVMQMLIFGVTSLVVEFFVLLGYGALASRARRLATHRSFAAWLNRLEGMLLIGAGAGLAMVKKAID
jgi:homoserine/homoserine lactone efflux protein